MRRRVDIGARAAVTVLLLAVGACALHARAPWIELMDSERPSPVVDRLADDTLRVRWPVAWAGGPVKVYAGTSPDAIDLEAPVARTRGSQNAVTLRGLDPRERHYFELVPESGATPRIVAERRLPLQGTDNFRDLGGYVTEDGRVVRWGRIYRSNALSELTPRDLDYLGSLGIRLVCDFRSVDEREREPDRTPEGAKPSIAALPIQVEGVDPSSMRERIRTGRIERDAMERTMEAAYRSFVTRFRDQYATMMRRIQDPAQLPSILHCTAGKDRAGFASAVVLLALGVSEEDVIEDYLLTNEYRGGYNRFILRVVPLYSLLRTSADDLAPLLEARESYIRAAFDEIHRDYGSVDAYLTEGLGVTAAERERMQTTLLRVPGADEPFANVALR